MMPSGADVHGFGMRRAIALRESPEAMLQLFLLQDQCGDKAAAVNTARYLLWRMGCPRDRYFMFSQPMLKTRLELSGFILKPESSPA